MDRDRPASAVIQSCFRCALCAAFLLTAVSRSASQQIQRPAITGFSQVAFYASAPDTAKHFYIDLLGL